MSYRVAKRSACCNSSGFATLPDLQLALDDGRLKQVAEKALDERLKPAAAALDIEARRLTLGRAADITEQVLAGITRCCPAIRSAHGRR